MSACLRRIIWCLRMRTAAVMAKVAGITVKTSQYQEIARAIAEWEPTSDDAHATIDDYARRSRVVALKDGQISIKIVVLDGLSG